MNLLLEHFKLLFPPCAASKRATYEGIGAAADDNALEILSRLAAFKKCSRMLELYTYKGQTALCLAKACPSAEIVTVDISKEMALPSWAMQESEILPRAEIGAAFAGTEEAKRIRQIVAIPTQIDWRSLGAFDLAFIDGNHTTPYLVHDTLAALRCLADDGVIAWHDFCNRKTPDVERFVVGLNEAIGDRIIYVSPTTTCFCLLDADSKAKISKAACEMYAVLDPRKAPYSV
jgi:predicted O-methyltransferase YrrM